MEATFQISREARDAIIDNVHSGLGGVDVLNPTAKVFNFSLKYIFVCVCVCVCVCVIKL